MSELQKSLVLMAKYHKWAYERLFAAINKPTAPAPVTEGQQSFVLTHQQYHDETVGLFFGSVHGTLVHLYFADILWYTRMQLAQNGTEAAALAAVRADTGLDTSQISVLWGTEDHVKWTKQYRLANDLDDRHVIQNLILRQCDRWISFVEQQTEETLTAPFSYLNTKGKPFSKVLGPTLMHAFNHGTHHRGQVTAALTMLHGRSLSPILDLLYYMDESS